MRVERREIAVSAKSILVPLSTFLFLRKLLRLPFFAALLALLNLTDFACDGLVVVASVDGVEFFLEGVQFLAGQSRAFLFCLCLADFADGVLYLLVALAQQLFGLFLRFAQYLLPLALYLVQLVFVAVDLALQRLLVLVDGLPLALPIALVAHDVLQILVALDIL